MSQPALRLVEGSSMDKSKALSAALSQIERQFGKGSIMRLGKNDKSMDVEVISSGSLGLDIALGVGGLPRGRVVEIYGPESSGKTTLALHTIAEAAFFFVRARVGPGAPILPRTPPTARPLLVAAHRSVPAGCRDSYRGQQLNSFSVLMLGWLLLIQRGFARPRAHARPRRQIAQDASNLAIMFQNRDLTDLS